MKKILVLIFMLVVSGTLTPAQTSLERRSEKDRQLIMSTIRDWLDALVRKDLEALDRIIADDYLITVSDGRVLNKTEDLEPVKSAEVRFESADTEDVKVRIFDKTAVVTGRGIYRINYKGKASTIYERFTDIYVKRNGRWQPVASHSTSLKPPSTQ